MPNVTSRRKSKVRREWRLFDSGPASSSTSREEVQPAHKVPPVPQHGNGINDDYVAARERVFEALKHQISARSRLRGYRRPSVASVHHNDAVVQS